MAVSGASGALYAERTLRAFLEMGLRVEVVLTRYGARLLKDERDLPGDARKLHEAMIARHGDDLSRGSVVPHDIGDLGASIASGSHPVHGMVVVPASIRTVASLATGVGESLLDRAAMVNLKEKRPLVIVPRETPYNRIFMENMIRLHDAGALILPANPGFYMNPQSLDDLADFMVGRILDHFNLQPNPDWIPRWNPKNS
jgi:4-hydroxy-3-polyprenylbenzoate decarboxylase